MLRYSLYRFPLNAFFFVSLGVSLLADMTRRMLVPPPRFELGESMRVGV